MLRSAGVRTEETRKAREMVCWARVMVGGLAVATSIWPEGKW